jgi:hypothetical protein
MTCTLNWPTWEFHMEKSLVSIEKAHVKVVWVILRLEITKLSYIINDIRYNMNYMKIFK